jgi:5'-deoxynucleotidase YfbR-like HD superfamily hydrolase
VTERLDRLLEFLEVADGLKTVERAGYIADGSRHETDTDHTWHMALYALVLAGETGAELDLARTLSMVLIHDMVEIFAGDVVVYDAVARQAAKEREVEAAERLFGLLPEDLRIRFESLWQEFEQGQTDEARFARSLDRLQAFAQNVISGGKSWKERAITRTVSASVNVEARTSFPVVGALYDALERRAEEAHLWSAPFEGRSPGHGPGQSTR